MPPGNSKFSRNHTSLSASIFLGVLGVIRRSPSCRSAKQTPRRVTVRPDLLSDPQTQKIRRLWVRCGITSGCSVMETDSRSAPANTTLAMSISLRDSGETSTTRSISSRFVDCQHGISWLDKSGRHLGKLVNISMFLVDCTRFLAGSAEVFFDASAIFVKFS